jgi:hypothetical protein
LMRLDLRVVGAGPKPPAAFLTIFPCHLVIDPDRTRMDIWGNWPCRGTIRLAGIQIGMNCMDICMPSWYHMGYETNGPLLEGRPA